MYILNDETGIADKNLYKKLLKEVNKNSVLKKLFSNKIKIEDSVKLDKLYIKECKVDNLEFLKFFPNLEALDISDCGEINDIGGVRYLSKINGIFIYNTNIEDLRAIGECTSLEWFEYKLEDIGYRRKTSEDFEFINNIPNLREVDFSGNSIGDISFLTKNKSLREIALIGNPVENICVLSDLSLLEVLEIDNCGLTSLEGIEKIHALRMLYASCNKLDEQQIEYYNELLSGVADLKL